MLKLDRGDANAKLAALSLCVVCSGCFANFSYYLKFYVEVVPGFWIRIKIFRFGIKLISRVIGWFRNEMLQKLMIRYFPWRLFKFIVGHKNEILAVTTQQLIVLTTSFIIFSMGVWLIIIPLPFLFFQTFYIRHYQTHKHDIK